MIEAMNDILTLFACSFWGALIVGAVCPLIGVYFVIRRVVFLGIAVPQFAAAGVAFGFMTLPWWNEMLGHPGECPGEAEGGFTFHLFWAAFFTVAALLILAFLGRKDHTASEGRIAAGYAIAGAVTVLFLSGSALGLSHVQALLRGELLTLDADDLWIIGVIYTLIFIVLLFFGRNFLLIGYDREAAISLGYKPLFWDMVFFALVGASISVGVLTVGPLVIFGLMVIPPLAARLIAFNMLSFFLFASSLGLLTAALGFLASYLLDWPIGPTDVVVSFLLMTMIRLVRNAVDFLRKLR
ncbi:MAG: metal ABC transporter permease [Planctomycetes bacterium]|nr:metal ABC transporter permease [Planctomycetota bacterium]